VLLHLCLPKDAHQLSFDELKARYNFTIMALLRAWDAPWTPATHRSFQPEMQVAVRTFALCTHRLNFPNEIVQKVASFLNRTWWPDSRRQCWSFDCQLDQIGKQMSRRIQKRPAKNKSVVCQPCSGCGVAWYCSKRCKGEDMKAGHKRVCETIFSTGSPEDDVLFRKVFKNELPAFISVVQESGDVEALDSSFDGRRAGESEVVVVEGDDDDGSWESMDTDEEDETDEGSMSSKTKAICQYFKAKVRGQML
jgi:hypothetical protein